MDDKGNLFMNVSARTPSRLVMTIAFTITALLLGIIGAVAAGTGTVTPPPKIAFVAAGGNFPDALAVGPMAGRLGAPLFLTPTESLNDETKDALVAYGAELIIVAGGPNTVHDAVLAQISTATGLAVKEFDDKPTSGIVRAFGTGREATAAKLADLLANYNPNFLPVDATAADSTLLDGKDSTAFLGATAKAADADKLDGIDSTGFSMAPTRALVPAAAFTEDGFDPGTVFFSFSAQDIRGTAGGYGCITAPVDVPEGYVPSSMTVYGFDNDGSNVLSVTFRASTSSSGSTVLAQVVSTGESTSYVSLTDNTIEALPVGPPLFYSLSSCLSSADIRIRGVEITLVAS